MRNAVQSIVQGPYLTGLEQYGASGTAQMGAVWSDPSQTLPNPTVANAGNLQDYLQNSITHYNTTPPSVDQEHAPIYAVVLDPTDTGTSGSSGGFNAPGSYTVNPGVLGSSVPINMIEVGAYESGGQVDMNKFGQYFSHELAERVVDDHQMFNSPYVNSDIFHSQQVADGEQNANEYSYRLNGALVQAYWSDADQAAIVPDVPSPVANFVLTPTYSLNPNTYGFQSKYDLTVTSSLHAVSFSSGPGGVSVIVDGETATFGLSDDPLNSITVNGASQLYVNDSSDANPSAITVGNIQGKPGWGYVRGVLPVDVDFSYATTSLLESGTSQLNGNVVNVQETGTQTNIICDPQHTTSINIGDSTSVQSIQGAVSVSSSGFPPLGGPSPITITLNDSSDPSSHTFYVENDAATPGWGDVRSLAPAQISYQYEFTASLTIITGSASGGIANVLETGVPTNINGQSGVASTVQIGDNSGVRNIVGQLTISGPTNLLGPNPAATIIIDDTNDLHARTIHVEDSTTPGATGVGEVAGMAPANIYFQYWNTVSLTINTGLANNNVVDVLQTGVTTNLNTVNGSTVNIGYAANGAQGLLSDLNIASPGMSLVRYATINVDDTGDTSARSVTLADPYASSDPGEANASSISGLAPGTINYFGLYTASLSIVTDAIAANSINVLENNVPTYLVGGALTYVYLGDGTTGAQSIFGNLYISSSESGTPDSGNMFISVNDLADGTARTATVSTYYPFKRLLSGLTIFDDPWGSMSGLLPSPATINYEYLDTSSVLIDGNAADQKVNPPGATPVYLNAFPVVTSVSPSTGSLNGGTVVTILGTFLDLPGRFVDFGHKPGHIISDTPTEIQVVAPAATAAGTVDVRVGNVAGKSATSAADKFTYVVPPVVTSIAPGAGPLGGGNTVFIFGTDLNGATAVDFGQNPGTILAVFQTDPPADLWEMIAIAPAGAQGTVDVTVTTGGGPSATSSADVYAYFAAPVFGHMRPSSGPTTGGTVVMISGASLESVTEVDFGQTAVTFPNFQRQFNAIRVTSPMGAAGTVHVTLKSAGGTTATSAADQFTYIAAPVLIDYSGFPFALTPNFGPYEGGTTVTINGANLANATKVNFGAIAGTIVSDTATQIVAISPAQPLGSIVDVTVTTAGGTSDLLYGDLFQYTHEPPYVYGVSPPSGDVAGGTTVTITGLNLLGATEVDFGSVLGGPKATSFTINSPTQITATSPAETAGTVDVTVVTPGERSAISAADHFTYTSSAVPTVSSLSPSSGLVAGGTTVTITGTNLTGATAVDFGSTAGTIVPGTDTGTQIVATSPAGAAGAGAVDVTVVTLNGTSATSPADQFTYQVPGPVVSLINPASGATSGGTIVTISGSNLSGATAVSFGGTPATSFTVNANGTITATSPAGTTGAVDVTVVTAGGTSALSPYDQFHYGAAPTISALIDGGSLIHNLGPSNTRGFGLYIFGGNLTGATEVDFGAVAGTIIDDRGAAEGSIYVTTPSEGPGTVDVRVVTPSGTSAITPADQFTFTAGPFVTNATSHFIDAGHGFFGADGPLAGGTPVLIQGYHLSDVTAVNFGNTPAASFTYDSYYATIVAVSPPGAAGTVSVTVTSPEGTSTVAPALDLFTYVPAPTVSGISPASGPLAGGNSVVITGTNLLGATVYFGGRPLTNFLDYSDTDTSILVDAPAGASLGTVDVTVVTDGGTSPTPSADQYTYLTPPVLSGLSTSNGAIAGGTTVTISGTALAGATAVDFGGVAGTIIPGTNTDAQIIVTSPAGAAGTVDVTVTALNGTSAISSADQFTYEGPPSISTQDTNSGPVKGGTLVTLTGASLANATAVDFGANPGTIFSDTNGQIVVLSPEATADAAGTVGVTVMTQHGTSPSGQFAFTYVLPPAVTGISQSSGPAAGGTLVTISGANLSGATAVDFGGTPATSFIRDGDGQIRAFSPAGAGSTVDVTVVTVGGTSATSSVDQFTYVAAPHVSAISPVAGPTSGGTQVTITGTDLAGASRVDFSDGFGDDRVGTIVSDTSGQILVSSPWFFGFAGTFDVTVTTIGGTSATSAADQFTYVDAPSVSGVSPGLGNTLGSNIVTINGANLGGATAVDFGQHAGTILYDSANQIQVVSPAGTAGLVDVTVVAPGGTSPTSSADRFLYVGAPLAVADSYTVTPNTTLTVAAAGVLANDTDPQQSPLTAELLANPLHGALSFNGDGSFTYTPDNGYVGVDGFVYQADNGIFASAPTTVSLAIGTLTVTTTADSGPGSLRQAILDANGKPGLPHIVQFELPAAPQTINLLTPLPAATDPLTVSLDATQNVTVALSSGSTWNDNNSLTVTGAGTLTLRAGIEGPGNLTVDAGSSLTANHIVQGALVIGGTADAPAMLTIAASDSSGNPLISAAVASSSNSSISALSNNVAGNAGTEATLAERLAAIRARRLAQQLAASPVSTGANDASSGIAPPPVVVSTLVPTSAAIQEVISTAAGVSPMIFVHAMVPVDVNAKSAAISTVVSGSLGAPVGESSFSIPLADPIVATSSVTSQTGSGTVQGAAATRKRLDADAVAAAFGSDNWEWLGSDPVAGPTYCSMGNVGGLLLGDDLLEAIAKKWGN
ncbi:MAG TPA: IPT/TIG domain-containing protein [Pirellulales bacterium]|nr:IPT/TIG domain-containing protein [Pirellulales bacterium]